MSCFYMFFFVRPDRTQTREDDMEFSDVKGRRFNFNAQSYIEAAIECKLMFSVAISNK